MARQPRLALPHQLFVVGQRGHNGMTVFADEADRRAYLELLDESMRGAGVALHGYGLAADALALLVGSGADADGPSRAMQAQGRRYGARFNLRHGRSGTLWDGRFRAAAVDADSSFIDALLFVEALPLRRGEALDEASSSATHHLGLRRNRLLAEHPAFWMLGNTPFEREIAYRVRWEAGLAPVLLDRFEQALRRGAAIGPAGFVADVARSSGRDLTPRPRGRPPKPRDG